MFNDIHIIGCGTIGSNLSINLANHDYTKELHLYDFDIVDYESNNYIFPFNKRCCGLLKTDVIKSYIDSTSDIIVHSHNVRISKPIVGEMIIDCRDKKEDIINSNLKISLDGNVLILDNTKDCGNFDFPRYCVYKDPTYIILSMAIIMNFIKLGLQKNQKLMYDLDNMFTDYFIIS